MTQKNAIHAQLLNFISWCTLSTNPKYFIGPVKNEYIENCYQSPAVNNCTRYNYSILNSTLANELKFSLLLYINKTFNILALGKFI